MMLKDLFAQRLIVEVRIYLCCSDVSMSEEHLDDTEVSTTFEHGRGEGMAEGMRRNGFLDTCSLCLPLHHDEDHDTREVMAAAVEEHIILLTRFDLHLLAVLEPQLQFVDGTVGDRHEPFLVALAHDADEMLIEVQVRQFEVRQFRDPQSTGEERFDNGAVALSLVCLQVDAVLELVYLLRREVCRQVLWQDG